MTFEDILMKEINGDIVEHILEDEDDQPVRESTPLPSAGRGRKRSFGNPGGLREAAAHRR